MANMLMYYGLWLRGSITSQTMLTIPILYYYSGIQSTDYQDYPIFVTQGVTNCKTQPNPINCIASLKYLISDEFLIMKIFMSNLISVKYQGAMRPFN